MDLKQQTIKLWQTILNSINIWIAKNGKAMISSGLNSNNFKI